MSLATSVTSISAGTYASDLIGNVTFLVSNDNTQQPGLTITGVGRADGVVTINNSTSGLVESITAPGLAQPLTGPLRITSSDSSVLVSGSVGTSGTGVIDLKVPQGGGVQSITAAGVPSVGGVTLVSSDGSVSFAGTVSGTVDISAVGDRVRAGSFLWTNAQSSVTLPIGPAFPVPITALTKIVANFVQVGGYDPLLSPLGISLDVPNQAFIFSHPTPITQGIIQIYVTYSVFY